MRLLGKDVPQDGVVYAKGACVIQRVDPDVHAEVARSHSSVRCLALTLVLVLKSARRSTDVGCSATRCCTTRSTVQAPPSKLPCSVCAMRRPALKAESLRRLGNHKLKLEEPPNMIVTVGG